MKRRQAREIAFALIFEAGFYAGKDPLNTENAGLTGNPDYEEIYRLAAECREFEDDDYVKEALFGVRDHLDAIDQLIADSAVGWKSERLSKVSLAIMRLCVYEMLYRDDIPYSIAINEAVELAKKYDYDKAPRFINGVVNTIAEKEGLKQK